MIDGSEKRNRQLAFELHNSHVCEKRSNITVQLYLFINYLKTRLLKFGQISVKW